jgi:ABC-type Zn2+ transport system substrate-binding protein/surface adhesin
LSRPESKRFYADEMNSMPLPPFIAPGITRSIARNIVASGAVSCVFGEPQGSAHQIDIVAGEVAVRRATLDAIGVNRPAGPGLYFDMMRANYAAFVACLGGAS